MITFFSFKNTLHILCRENWESENLLGLSFPRKGNIVCWVPVPVVAMLEDLALGHWASPLVGLSQSHWRAEKWSGVLGDRVLAGEPVGNISSEKLSLRVLGNFWKNSRPDDPDFWWSCKDSTDLHSLVFFSAIFSSRLSCQDLGLFIFLIWTISSAPNILWHSLYNIRG